MNKQELDEHVRKMVEGWPPLTPAQRDKLQIIFNTGSHADSTQPPSAYTLEQQRLERERDMALAEARADAAALLACDVCDQPPEAHWGITHHRWEPGRAQKLLGKA
jgi:hypothetical protein